MERPAWNEQLVTRSEKSIVRLMRRVHSLNEFKMACNKLGRMNERHNAGLVRSLSRGKHGLEEVGARIRSEEHEREGACA